MDGTAPPAKKGTEFSGSHRLKDFITVGRNRIERQVVFALFGLALGDALAEIRDSLFDAVDRGFAAGLLVAFAG